MEKTAGMKHDAVFGRSQFATTEVNSKAVSISPIDLSREDDASLLKQKSEGMDQ